VEVNLSEQPFQVGDKVQISKDPALTRSDGSRSYLSFAGGETGRVIRVKDNRHHSNLQTAWLITVRADGVSQTLDYESVLMLKRVPYLQVGDRVIRVGPHLYADGHTQDDSDACTQMGDIGTVVTEIDSQGDVRVKWDRHGQGFWIVATSLEKYDDSKPAKGSKSELPERKPKVVKMGG
jgi:hypothetical protein